MIIHRKYRPAQLFHTIMFLKIHFHPYQPTFGLHEFLFFPFSSKTKIPYAHFLNGLILKKKKKKKTASNVLLRRTNNANEIRKISPKKFWFLQVGPPKDFEKSTRLIRTLFIATTTLCQARRPGRGGGISGPCSPKSLLVPPPPQREVCSTSENCAPKETGQVPLESIFGPVPPKGE